MTRSTTMNRYPAVVNSKGLSVDQLKQFPALFATTPHPKMSERYTFLSTADVIEPLLQEGYICTRVAQRATRHGHRDPRFTRHVVTLRRVKDKPVVGDVYPTVQMCNSHDGQCRYQLFGGIERLVCLNGMTVSTLEFKGLSLFHRGDLKAMLDQIKDGVFKAASALKIVEKLAALKLTAARQKTFAQKAAELVWDTVDFDTGILLGSRREGDNGDDAWRVYNRIQENLIRGGVEIQHTTGQARGATTRGITNIRRDLDVNLGLWQLASKLVQ